jgi:hypothetical protein
MVVTPVISSTILAAGAAVIATTPPTPVSTHVLSPPAGRATIIATIRPQLLARRPGHWKTLLQTLDSVDKLAIIL